MTLIDNKAVSNTTPVYQAFFQRPSRTLKLHWRIDHKIDVLPSHPELLDFLAAELIRKRWSLKALHRLFLTSCTYRLSSAPNADSFAADPQNLKHCRFDMRRLSAEELRDSVLALSGKLNLKTGGPWVYPPLPAEVLATASRPGKGWLVSADLVEHFRRSIYVHVKRGLRRRRSLQGQKPARHHPATHDSTTQRSQLLPRRPRPAPGRSRRRRADRTGHRVDYVGQICNLPAVRWRSSLGSSTEAV